MFRATSVSINPGSIDIVLLQSQEDWDTFSVYFDNEGRLMHIIRLSDSADITNQIGLAADLERLAREAIVARIDSALALSADDEDDGLLVETITPVSFIQWRVKPDDDSKRFLVSRIVWNLKSGMPDPELEESLFRQLFIEQSAVAWRAVLGTLFPYQNIPEFSYLILTPDLDGELAFTNFEPYPDTVAPAARVPWACLVLEAGLLATLDKPETAEQYKQTMARVARLEKTAEKQAKALIDRVR